MRAEAAAAFCCELAASEALESLARAHNYALHTSISIHTILDALDNFMDAFEDLASTPQKSAGATICTRNAFNEAVPACLAWTAIRAHLGAAA